MSQWKFTIVGIQNNFAYTQVSWYLGTWELEYTHVCAAELRPPSLPIGNLTAKQDWLARLQLTSLSLIWSKFI